MYKMILKFGSSCVFAVSVNDTSSDELSGIGIENSGKFPCKYPNSPMLTMPFSGAGTTQFALKFPCGFRPNTSVIALMSKNNINENRLIFETLTGLGPTDVSDKKWC